jgi:sulfoacetaldehyde dehydrogenase
MWPEGKLAAAVTAQDAPRIARPGRAGARGPAERALPDGRGNRRRAGPFPFSGEKLSPVLAVYRARDFDHACAIVGDIYAFQGAGHSVSIHSADDEHILRLGLELPVSRVIVNQIHCYATGGSFDNGLPFSLSMGCGTWGRNNFSDNMNYRHYLNITRISRKIAPREPALEEIFGEHFRKYGK